MAGEASTPETRASLAERLWELSRQMQMGSGDPDVAVKLIFDLREAGELLKDLDGLLHLILVEMLTATNRDLACDGGVGDEEGQVWKKIELRAHEIRERLDKANPERQIAR